MRAWSTSVAPPAALSRSPMASPSNSAPTPARYQTRGQHLNPARRLSRPSALLTLADPRALTTQTQCPPPGPGPL
eukprot:243959-Prymnesium_polylepis.1